MEKVTVIGGGNGAFATAADLTIRGNQVTLFELPRFAAGLSEVIEKGGIEMEAYANNGLTGGFAKLHKITTDIGEALAESDIVFIVVPTYSMDTIASLCAPHLRDGQIIVLTPANFGGALYFHNVMRSAGCTAKVTLVELSCMIYACRKKTPSSVWVRGYKHNMGTACFPSCDTDVVMPRLKTLYPHLKEYHNVLETGLSNINTTMHTSIMLLNAACIDNEEDRLFYRECCTKSLDNLMDALDADGIPYDDTPGVSSFCGAAAALCAEYTLPNVSQTVIITRMEGRTPVPEAEQLAKLAAHGATMVIFLSIGLVDKVQQALLSSGGYRSDTPAAVVYKATWPEQKVVRCTVSTLAEETRKNGITKTALIVVGDFLGRDYDRSKLYDPAFTTEFRQGTEAGK